MLNIKSFVDRIKADNTRDTYSNRVKAILRDTDAYKILGKSLRKPQIEALSGFTNWLNRGGPLRPFRAHVVLPTAVGKTLVMYSLADICRPWELKKKMIIMTYSNDKAEEMIQTLTELNQERWGNQAKIGRVFDGHKEIDANGLVASWECAMDTLTDEQLAKGFDNTLLFSDEADVKSMSKPRRNFVEKLTETHHGLAIGLVKSLF